MKNITIEQLELCIFENKMINENFLNSRKYKKVNVLNYTQIDDKLVVIETDKKWYFYTCDLDNKQTLTNISKNRDYQILITLWYKYNWLNSQFSNFTSKMLWIII